MAAYETGASTSGTKPRLGTGKLRLGTGLTVHTKRYLLLASTETFMGLSTMDNADLLDSEKCGEKGID